MGWSKGVEFGVRGEDVGGGGGAVQKGLGMFIWRYCI